MISYEVYAMYIEQNVCVGS